MPEMPSCGRVAAKSSLNNGAAIFNAVISRFRRSISVCLARIRSSILDIAQSPEEHSGSVQPNSGPKVPATRKFLRPPGLRQPLVAGMVRMPLQDRKCPVKLLEEHDAGEFVRKRHFAERQTGGGGLARLRREAVGSADGEKDWYGAVPLLLQETGEFFGAERLSAGIEQDERVALLGVALTRSEPKHSTLIAELQAFDFGIARNAVQVFSGQRVDGWLLGAADPCDFQFHAVHGQKASGAVYFFFRAGFRAVLAEVDFLAAFRETDFFAFATDFFALAFLGARFRSAGPKRRAVFHKRSRS